MHVGDAFLKYEKYSCDLKLALTAAFGTIKADSLTMSISLQEFEELWNCDRFKSSFLRKLDRWDSLESDRIAEVFSGIIQDDSQSSAAA